MVEKICREIRSLGPDAVASSDSFRDGFRHHAFARGVWEFLSVVVFLAWTGSMLCFDGVYDIDARRKEIAEINRRSSGFISTEQTGDIAGTPVMERQGNDVRGQ